MARRRLTIDFDPDRPAGISATDEEKVLASRLTWTARLDLHALGWPDPIEADSGNGYHLNYAVDLPADDGGLVERFLESLSARYSSPTVKVDASLFTPLVSSSSTEPGVERGLDPDPAASIGEGQLSANDPGGG